MKRMNLKLSQESLTTELVLNNLLTRVPCHVYWKNENLVYLGCNEQQAQSLGLKSSIEVIGKTDFDLPWDKALAKRFWENDLEVLTTGQPKSVEESTVINGEPAVVISLKTPIRDGNSQICGVLGISVDVTAQKRTEQRLIEAKEALEVANNAKQAFMENMRHDIRTPLSGITGCAQMIKEMSHDLKIKEYADDLVCSSQALTSLLNEVLELIKLGDKNLPLFKKRFNLKELIEGMITLNRARAAQKNLQLVCHYDPHIPRCLMGDPLRVERILLELITNALNFTEEGKVEVKAELARHYQREVIVKITVQDTGMGIPLERQCEVFTRFKRITPSYQGIHAGTGLGLSILKQLVDDLDSELYFESEVGRGSTFTCVLPFKQALLDSGPPESPTQKPLSNETHDSIPMDVTKPQALFVLLVEDNEIAAKVANLLLTRLGATVTLATTGEAAIRQATTESYNLILLDIGLPDINGMIVAQKIREWEAEKNKYTRIIALTAHVDKESEQKCLDAGIDKVISKPLTEAMAQKLIAE